MLLNDLFKNTNKDHIEYEILKESLLLIEEITKSVNERKRESENKTVIQEVQQILKGKYNINTNINRNFLIDVAVKLSFPLLKISNESYKIMMFDDIIFLVEMKGKGYVVLLYNLIQLINKTGNDIELRVVYKKKIGNLVLSFKENFECNEIINIILNQTQQEILNLLNKGKFYK
jgi:hypothetical protein